MEPNLSLQELTFETNCYLKNNLLEQIDCDRMYRHMWLGVIPLTLAPYIIIFISYSIIIVFFDLVLRRTLKDKYHGWKRVAVALFLILLLVISTSLLFGFPYVY